MIRGLSQSNPAVLESLKMQFAFTLKRMLESIKYQYADHLTYSHHLESNKVEQQKAFPLLSSVSEKPPDPFFGSTLILFRVA